MEAAAVGAGVHEQPTALRRAIGPRLLTVFVVGTSSGRASTRWSARWAPRWAGPPEQVEAERLQA
jgi:hypothetical protein